MSTPNIVHVTQPVIDQAEPRAIEHRANTAAPVVTGDHHMLHSKDVDGVLQHCEAIEIGMDYYVRDVSMNEEFAGRQSNDFVRWNAAVRASNPEICRRLLFPQPLEETRVARDGTGRPIGIVVQETLER